MEKEISNQIYKKNGLTHGISTELPKTYSWHVNITKIDLSAKNIDTLDDKVQLPANLLELNLSHNKLVEVPVIVLELEKLKNLDLSHNAIEYFDKTPNFCHTIEQLDLSTNSLLGPPYWIWAEKPKYLSLVNLSCNTNLTKSFVNNYLEELMQYQTSVIKVDLSNCGFKSKNTDLLGTFSNAKIISFGRADYTYHGANIVGEVPNVGLEKCHNVERLNLSNTHIHTINSNIDRLKSLYELNLACNNINGLPNEFCNLANLGTCILSNNDILYLPDDMYKLKNLSRLCIDSNKLCMLPENLSRLPNLQALDLYDNQLYEIAGDYSHLQEFDLALNYLDEPDDVDYIEKKEKIRLLHENRCNGRKLEVVQPESEYSSTESDDEEYYRALFSGEVPHQESPKPENDQSRRSSSPEDWDSDAHWIPHDIKPPPNTTQAWIHYIKRKMREGNFCPVDAHVVSVSEQVMFERGLNREVDVEVPGQFDDYSSDDS